MQNASRIIAKLQNNPKYQSSLEETIRNVLANPKVKSFIEEHESELSQDMITNSLSKLNEYVLETKAIEAGREGQNPGFVPRLFINQNYIDIRYVPTQRFIEQDLRRKRQSLLNNRMMSQDVRNAQLAEFDLNTPERQLLMNEILAFIQSYEANKSQAKGLFITGPFGVGKTYLLGALANFLADKSIGVTMLHYPTFASEIKATISTNTTLETLNKIKNVSVLILDDIGAESNSPWLRDEVLSVLLEHRMKESLTTFFTSNFNMNELETHLASTRDSVELLKAKRLMERIRYLAREVTLSGINRRQKD